MKRFIEIIEIKEENEYFRLYEGIVIGEYTLSIQGSKSHYCSPRSTIPVESYNQLEIAFWKDGREFIDASESNELKDFPRLDELMDRFNGGVYGYVDVDLIQDLYLYIVELSNGGEIK